VERIVDAARITDLGDRAEIRLPLEPEGLGAIEVHLRVQGDGLRAVIVAEHERTRALLAQQQSALSAAFERNALRLTGFSVDVGLGGESERYTPGESEPFAAPIPHARPAALSRSNAEVNPGGRLSLRA
jgi:flagellar hook-length control protein FliK